MINNHMRLPSAANQSPEMRLLDICHLMIPLLFINPNALLPSGLMSSEGNRLVAVKWTIHKIVSFLARIQLNGIDRIGIVSEVTGIISDELNVNMRNVNITVHEGIFEGTIDLYVHHTKDLNNLILKLSDIKGVDSVKRVEDFS